jgi:hypothetical protein
LRSTSMKLSAGNAGDAVDSRSDEPNVPFEGGAVHLPDRNRQITSSDPPYTPSTRRRPISVQLGTKTVENQRDPAKNRAVLTY